MSTHKYGSSWAVREPRVSARLVSVIQVRLRNSTPAGGPLSVAEPAGPQRVSRLALALGKAGSVTGGLGARMALEPGHGRTAVPVRCPQHPARCWPRSWQASRACTGMRRVSMGRWR